MNHNYSKLTFNKSNEPIAFSEVLRFVWSYFGRFPLTVFLAYLAITISSIADILGPLLIKWLVDTITSENIAEAERYRQAIFIVFVIFGQGFILHTSYRIAHFFNCYTDSQAERLVAAEIHDRIQHFSTDWHANSFAGATVTGRHLPAGNRVGSTPENAHPPHARSSCRTTKPARRRRAR